MANEKVSQLTPLTAGEISPTDLFLISDLSSKESKKLEASQLLLYFEVSGTFNSNHATTADLADTASYVLGSNVAGAVTNATNAVSASHALNSILSDTASYAKTASITLTCVTHTTTADTASYLIYSANNGTASHAMTASSANYALTSSTLLYVPGLSKNTASYAITASYSDSSLVSVSSSYSITSSYSNSSSFALSSISSSYASTASYISSSILGSVVKARCNISWSYGVQYPQQLSSYNIKPQIGDGIENGGGIQYLTFYSTGGFTTVLFGVNFQTPLSNNRYGFMGAGNTYMDPIIAAPSVNGFTMSVVTTPPTFYTTPPAGRLWYQALGFTQFQIFE